MSTSEVKQVLALIRSRSSSEQLAFVESLIVTLAQQVETAQSALSEANERASILQTALHERTVERDEARKALASPPPPKGEALPVVSEDWEPPAWTHGLVPARPSPRVSREEVARIIDGGAFNAAEDAINYHERYPEDGPWFVMSCAGDALHAVQWAYAKADTILALLSRGEG